MNPGPLPACPSPADYLERLRAEAADKQAAQQQVRLPEVAAEDVEQQLLREFDRIREESFSSGGESSWEDPVEDEPQGREHGLQEEGGLGTRGEAPDTQQLPAAQPSAAATEDLSADLNDLFAPRPRSSARRRRGGLP